MVLTVALHVTAVKLRPDLTAVSQLSNFYL